MSFEELVKNFFGPPFLLGEKYSKDLTKSQSQLVLEKYGLDQENIKLQKQVKSLEQSQQVLKNKNTELLKEREKLTKANTELAEKIKALNAQNNQLVASLADQSEIDLHNKRLANENRDLKTQKEN
ncbi:hypothetical protein HPSA50_1873 [Helicobacter pylori SouthAfrica50]|uniref:Uncharacterized protein n=1 Tax=Helicobacter pylori SouthAfrica50 TaxID=1352357 RepID=T2SDJ3_HELPX|nr:hypothetical protein HPSA50_1873 [Helicobacter pylori SouthAfrica50]